MPETAVAKTSGLQRCLDEIRQMIISGELLPGQKVNQADIAEQLNVSRIPVREALAKLQTEGVLTHKPHTGFTVSRFSSEDLQEIYLMRTLLETELIRSIDLTTVDVDELDSLNQKLSHLSAATEPHAYQQTNNAFHFRLFEYSHLKLVYHEIQRLWYISSFYRSLYMYDADSRLRVHDDHKRILAAVRAGDTEELINNMDAHRGATERLIVQRLGPARGR